MGANTVTCVDPVASRRDLAARFGATHVAPPEGFAEVAHAAGGELGFDAVLELSGHAAAFQSAWPRLRTGGTLVLVGSVVPGAPFPVELERIVRRHLTIRGIHNYVPRHLVSVIGFLTTHHHRYPFADLVAAWYPLTNVAEAFSHSANPDAIRIGVTPANRGIPQRSRAS